MGEYKKAYIAGGCFWGMEDLFRNRKGILDTEVGYQGGKNNNPTYKNHPGHAEGIELTYDEDQTSFREILDYFFRSIYIKIQEHLEPLLYLDQIFWFHNFY